MLPVTLIDHAKLPFSVRGISRVNSRGYRTGPGWDCGLCRLNEQNRLLLCRRFYDFPLICKIIIFMAFISKFISKI